MSLAKINAVFYVIALQQNEVPCTSIKHFQCVNVFRIIYRIQIIRRTYNYDNIKIFIFFRND
jgi:hypothetical protein